jgi:hypothetical protein
MIAISRVLAALGLTEAETVARIRAATKDRTDPWTEKELRHVK